MSLPLNGDGGLLGAGGFGCVYRVHAGSCVAAKVPATPEDWADLHNEEATLKAAGPHPNVVTCYGWRYFSEKGCLALCLELADRSLEKMLGCVTRLFPAWKLGLLCSTSYRVVCKCMEAAFLVLHALPREGWSNACSSCEASAFLPNALTRLSGFRMGSSGCTVLSGSCVLYVSAGST